MAGPRGCNCNCCIFINHNEGDEDIHQYLIISFSNVAMKWRNANYYAGTLRFVSSRKCNKRNDVASDPRRLVRAA